MTNIKSAITYSCIAAITLITTPLLAATSTSAITDGFYLGSGVAYSMIDEDGMGYGISYHGTGFKAYGGYLHPLTANLSLGLEVNYAYAGTLTADAITDNSDVSYFSLNTTAAYRINDRVSATGRIGAQKESITNMNQQDVFSYNPNLLIGGQANVYLTSHWSSYVSLDHLFGENPEQITSDDDHTAISMTIIGAGLQYNF